MQRDSLQTFLSELAKIKSEPIRHGHKAHLGDHNARKFEALAGTLLSASPEPFGNMMSCSKSYPKIIAVKPWPIS